MRIPPPARVLLAMAAAHQCVCAENRFTVAVFNYAAAPSSVIALAAEAAHRAFLNAGIESRWLICEPEGRLREPPEGLYLELFVMPQLRAPVTGHAGEHPAGYAMPSGFAHPRAYAFYDAATTAAGRTLRPVDVVLGCILAHEAGHLLGLHHQRYGVMRANLEPADMDNAVMGRAFNSEEKKRLRAALAASASGAVQLRTFAAKRAW